MEQQTKTATFGSGCFWCTEAVFKNLRGVTRVTSGYAGGHEDQPSYESVSAHKTGHAEVVQVIFDPSVLTYEQLVEVFFGTHDPTTLNRQGNDVGEQYRSVIFVHTPEQRTIAEKVKARLTHDHIFDRPIVTAIEPYTNFYQAEIYHQNYFEKNPDQPYCQAIISPKLAKFRATFAHLLRENE